ncbi:ABC transporter ATP-binding protein [Crateriforma spongiae]|uniref:Lipoprotein-releasing system ATP-binding protein LolD n=1 Tax=Crateriforma conspicua TaxID=2527996 RepID=A0A5C6FPM2_9PLAN|nr:Lipoprotein-releasing system ATP-binding protein LolD [Crateriforma conspicua]
MVKTQDTTSTVPKKHDLGGFARLRFVRIRLEQLSEISVFGFGLTPSLHRFTAGTPLNQKTPVPPDTNIVEIRNVSKHYADGDVKALDDVSLQIAKGELVSIVGPSGCGKSTLLNMIGILDRPTSGQVYFEGHRVDPSMNLDRLRSEKIGFVFQSFHLVPNLTAIENVQLPMMPGKLPPSARVARAKALLDSVGLSDRLNHRPAQLSNGQRQRVAICRALANAPSLVLADEPTGALDSQGGRAIMDILETVCRDSTATLVVVTHDKALADRSDRQIRLCDGKIVSD